MTAINDALNTAKSQKMLMLALALLQGLGLLLMQDWVSDLKIPGAYYSIIWPLYVVIIILPLSLMMLADEPRIKFKPILGFVAVAAACASYMGWVSWAAGHEQSQNVWGLGFGVFITWFLGLAFVGHYCLHQRWASNYVSLFNVSWRNAVKMLTAGVFVGLFWAALSLLAGLFNILGVHFFSDVIYHRYFIYPAITLSFSLGLSLYAAREEALAEFKRATLQVLGWLLPLVSLILLAFVLTLPFKGVHLLWDTGYATILMVNLIGLMVFLTNAAFQDGRQFNYPKWVLQVTNAGLLTLPIYIVLCAYALYLRIHPYGWTTERVWGTGVVVIVALYAFGYAFAAFRTLKMPANLLAQVKSTNVLAAASLIVLLVLFNSPILDPMRISVNSQLARLKNGSVNAAKFDYQYFRFDGGTYGDAALRGLIADTKSKNAAIIKPLAEAALKLDYRSWEGKSAEDGQDGEYEVARLKQSIPFYPVGSVVDEAFYTALSSELNAKNIYLSCPKNASSAADAAKTATKDAARDAVDAAVALQQGCYGLQVDLNQDKVAEVVVFASYGNGRVFQHQKNKWVYMGNLIVDNYAGDTDKDREALKLGNFKTVTPAWQVLSVGKSLYRLEEIIPRVPEPKTP